MNDIKDILRHRHGLGLTRDGIAAAVGVASGTVSHVLERAAAAGLTWPLPEDLDDDALRARLYPPSERDSGHVQPDWDAVIKEPTGQHHVVGVGKRLRGFFGAPRGRAVDDGTSRAFSLRRLRTSRSWPGWRSASPSTVDRDHAVATILHS